MRIMFFFVLSVALQIDSLFAQVDSGNVIRYPVSKKVEQVDDYFGTAVADPYRWLEDDNAAEVQQWVDEQNKLTNSFLETIPWRDEVRTRLTDLMNYPRYSLPTKKAGHYFFSKNDGLQNQALFYRTNSFGGQPEILLDPNQLSAEGTISLATAEVSRDGRYLAYSIARNGSDWNEIYVLDLVTKTVLDDHLEWVKFSGIAWKEDGFYYSRYDAPEPGKELSKQNEFQKIYYHRLGSSQDEDILVHENRLFPKRNRRAIVDKEEKYLFLTENESTYGNSLAFMEFPASKNEFDSPCGQFTPIVENFDSEYDLFLVDQGKFYLLTDSDAPNGRVVVVDAQSPQRENWKTIIPESDILLQGVSAAGDYLLARYLEDAASKLVLFDRQGNKIRDIELQGLGVCGVSSEKGEPEFFYSFTSFTWPTVIYRYDLTTNRSEELFSSQLKFNPDDYETTRVWYTGKDGSRAPILLTGKKGLKQDGNNPTLLYGYGGFNVSMVPNYSPARMLFLEQGGIFAVAILRGGGEYGENWHKAGTKEQKQNVFDDFIVAAEYLIAEKYTTPKNLAINGGSNGGLLVGAVMTQRPELFQVAIPAVGVLDMLRYQYFTIGWAWATDYGRSDDSPEMFEALYRYSPLHQVREGVSYPTTFILTSDHDDRVVPAHSFKFAATLQEKNTGSRAMLIRIAKNAGHGSGKPISKIIDESVDMYSFLMQQLGIDYSTR